MTFSKLFCHWILVGFGQQEVLVRDGRVKGEAGYFSSFFASVAFPASPLWSQLLPAGFFMTGSSFRGTVKAPGSTTPLFLSLQL